VLRRAHATEVSATDDGALVEASGVKVSTVDGDARNIKITEPWHLALAELLVP
jgi:2-C-methyl-D-erythritol 4-phosphate cytidylyltransferase